MAYRICQCPTSKDKAQATRSIHQVRKGPVDSQLGTNSRLLTQLVFAFLDEGALIFLSLLCSSLRNTAFPSSKIHALDMLLSIGRYVADDIKLDRLVPYIVYCLSDEVGLVRAHALRTLAKMVCYIRLPVA